MLKELILREFLSIGRFRSIGKRAGAGCEKVDTGFSHKSRSNFLESITVTLDRFDPKSP
jgi:hypothetical protein